MNKIINQREVRVGELIDALKEFDKDQIVKIDVEEHDYMDIEIVEREYFSHNYVVLKGYFHA
jgi:hypothetical protein